MKTNTFTFHAFYQKTSKGENALKFAASLCNLLAGSTLSVHLQIIAQATAEMNKIRDQRVMADVCRITGLSQQQIKLEHYKNHHSIKLNNEALVVHHELLPVKAHRVITFDESAIDTRCAAGPLLLPFDSFDSTELPINSVNICLTLAKLMKRKVVFYHTTWKDPQKESIFPENHMIANAKEHRQILEKMAQEAGVEFMTVIEFADSVVEGIIIAAHENQASMIIVTRGKFVDAGSYIMLAVEESSIPILVCNNAQNLKT